MTDMPRLSTHARLVHRMAAANGIDLLAETQTGRISADTLSDVIHSCTRCASVSGCRGWLAEHRTPVDTAPGFCRNKPWFDGLNGTE